jgi:hypothetical protein
MWTMMVVALGTAWAGPDGEGELAEIRLHLDAARDRLTRQPVLVFGVVADSRSMRRRLATQAIHEVTPTTRPTNAALPSFDLQAQAERLDGLRAQLAASKTCEEPLGERVAADLTALHPPDSRPLVVALPGKRRKAVDLWLPTDRGTLRKLECED